MARGPAVGLAEEGGRSVRGEGSWNVAWDGRPARWLHRPDSALLLFSVCACLAPAIEFFSDVNIEEGGNVVVDVDHQEKERFDGDDLNASAVISDDVKQDSSSSTAGSDYKVTGRIQILLYDSNCRLCFVVFFFFLRIKKKKSIFWSVF